MLFMGDFSVSNDLKHSAEVLSDVTKLKRAVRCLTEKTMYVR